MDGLTRFLKKGIDKIESKVAAFRRTETLKVFDHFSKAVCSGLAVLLVLALLSKIFPKEISGIFDTQFEKIFDHLIELTWQSILVGLLLGCLGVVCDFGRVGDILAEWVFGPIMAFLVHAVGLAFAGFLIGSANQYLAGGHVVSPATLGEAGFVLLSAAVESSIALWYFEGGREMLHRRNPSSRWALSYGALITMFALWGIVWWASNAYHAPCVKTAGHESRN
jgi:hypothetical protein